METKIELEVITNQLQSALNELKRKRLERNLIHDYITEALSRVKKLNNPAVNISWPDENQMTILTTVANAYLYESIDNSLHIGEKGIKRVLEEWEKMKSNKC